MSEALRSEVSESAFEYLLAEIIEMQPTNANDDEQVIINLSATKIEKHIYFHQDGIASFQQRVDNIGYEVGYR